MNLVASIQFTNAETLYDIVSFFECLLDMI